jgi:RimJ/RimL family protein N-acetyltransferase
MSFINGYVAPTQEEATLEYGPDPLDINFCFPIDISRLESARVRLTPLIPRQHAKVYYDQVTQHPELERCFSFRTQTFAQILNYLENFFRRNSTNVPFIVVDKTRPDPERPELGGSIAGVICLFRTSPMDLSTEIGWVITFPAFQRTFVTSNAVGILLRYCLQTPSDKVFPGLGLRRVQWTANAQNARSITAAERLGFKRESTLRWGKAVFEGSTVGHGKPIRKGEQCMSPHRPSRNMRYTSTVSQCKCI